MSQVPTLWKVLFGLILACLLACVVIWFVLLTNICSNPREPNAATQNAIPYGCHGMTVYITPLERDLLHWLHQRTKLSQIHPEMVLAMQFYDSGHVLHPLFIGFFP